MCEQIKFSWIEGFAEELDELTYDGIDVGHLTKILLSTAFIGGILFQISNWFVSFRSLSALFGGHFSYLVVHLCIIAVGILTVQHARANGPRFLQFWWGAMIHGVLSENGPAATKYWHAQALIMLFGKRLPLHMVFFYPSILYLAIIGVQKFRLSVCAEPAAIGILSMIMEIPFRIISVKFLHITYHDSDPIYSSKFYGVPWIEIFSSLIFSASYVANYYAFKYNFLSEDHIKWERVEYGRKEAVLTAASSVASVFSAFLQKVIFFHGLYDSFNISPSSCLLFLITIYFSVVVFMEGKGKEKEDEEFEGKFFLYYALGMYIACLLYVAMLCKPQNEISIGAHQPTGDCTTLICTRSPLGKVMKRKKYLCVDDVVERKNFVYNFACLPEGPPYLNAIWYTICGTPVRNRAQFITNIFSFIILVSTIFLKSWLTKEEKEIIVRKLSKFRMRRGYLRDRFRREPVVTFEETTVEYAEEPSIAEESE